MMEKNFKKKFQLFEGYAMIRRDYYLTFNRSHDKLDITIINFSI